MRRFGTMTPNTARRILEAAHQNLGPSWEVWVNGFMRGSGLKRLFGPKTDREGHWTSIAAYGRGVLSQGSRSAGIYLEPYTFSRQGASDPGVLLEVSALIPCGFAVDQGHHDALIASLASHVASEFPELAEESLIGRYPNRNPRREGEIQILVNGAGDDPEKDVEGDWGAVPEDAVWVTIAHSVDPRELTPEEIGVSSAIAAIKAKIALFYRVVDFVRGAVVDLAPQSVDTKALLGWCGEYVVWETTSGAQWRGGYAFPYDFLTNSLTIEVKTSLGVPPTQPFFSVNELSYAATAPAHDVVCVGVEVDIFERIKALVTRAMSQKSSAPLVDAIWLRTLSRDAKISPAALSAVADDLSSLLPLLVESAVVSRHPSVFSKSTFRGALHELQTNRPSIASGNVRVRL